MIKALSRPVETLRKWDSLAAQQRPLFGYLSADAHFFYGAVFGCFGLHALLEEPPARDFERARAQVFGALRRGRFYSAVDGAAPAGRVRFPGRSRRRAVPHGQPRAVGRRVGGDSSLFARRSPSPSRRGCSGTAEVIEQARGRGAVLRGGPARRLPGGSLPQEAVPPGRRFSLDCFQPDIHQTELTMKESPHRPAGARPDHPAVREEEGPRPGRPDARPLYLGRRLADLPRGAGAGRRGQVGFAPASGARGTSAHNLESLGAAPLLAGVVGRRRRGPLDQEPDVGGKPRASSSTRRGRRRQDEDRRPSSADRPGRPGEERRRCPRGWPRRSRTSSGKPATTGSSSPTTTRGSSTPASWTASWPRPRTGRCPFSSTPRSRTSGCIRP